MSPSDNAFLAYILSTFHKSPSVHLHRVGASIYNIHFKTTRNVGFSASVLPQNPESICSLQSMTEEFLRVVIIDVRIMPFLKMQDEIANYSYDQQQQKEVGGEISHLPSSVPSQMPAPPPHRHLCGLLH